MARRSFGYTTNKYGVSPKADRTADGTVFDSKWEKRAYEILRDTIGLDKFEIQPRYELQPHFRDWHGKMVRAINYEADFLILGEYVLDTKGFETPVFKMKEKMFKYKYQKDILKFKSKKQLMEFIDNLPNEEKV